jgi:Domain of Unknown Function (DUF928)
MRTIHTIKSLAATLALASAVVGAEPVAMITDLQGKVLSPSTTEAPAILASIEAGATLQVPEGGALVVVYFQSGREFTFKGPGTIKFANGEPQMLAGAKPDSRDPLMGKVAGAGKIKPVGKIQAAVVMRGSNQSARIKLDNMVGTRVLEPKPTFMWQAPEQGLSYDFELTDESGRMLLETQVQGTSFKLPESIRLEDGKTYTWLVGTKMSDGRKYTNAGDFTLAPGDLRRDIEAVRPAADAPIAEKVTFAAWLDQMQFHDEARKYWKQLAAARSGDANLDKLAH